MYDSFCKYQAALLAEFDRLREEYNFETVDASADDESVRAQLKARILGILESDQPPAVVSKPDEELIEALTKRVVGKLIPKQNGHRDHPESQMEARISLAAQSLVGNGRAAH
jgi:hypothetical protein